MTKDKTTTNANEQTIRDIQKVLHKYRGTFIAELKKNKVMLPNPPVGFEWRLMPKTFKMQNVATKINAIKKPKNL